MSNDDYTAPKERLRAAVPEQTPRYTPPDGFPRGADEEFRLNEAFSVIFNAEPASDLVLAYLRSVTLNLVSGPEKLDDLSLAHREGQRYLVALIERRVMLGRAREPQRRQ